MHQNSLQTLYKKIDTAAKNTARRSDDIALLLASKTQTADVILPYLESGHRLFGENRVQEAQEKWPALKKQYPDTQLHLIGPLQTNKVKAALAVFDVIETLDREKLAKHLAKESCTLPCYIQVNTGEEEQKAGIAPLDCDAFIAFCREDCALNIQGLMCIPPAIEPAAPHFALLNDIAARNALPYLSMGMSNDYETAIAFGATHIRIGRSAFGDRAA